VHIRQASRARRRDDVGRRPRTTYQQALIVIRRATTGGQLKSLGFPGSDPAPSTSRCARADQRASRRPTRNVLVVQGSAARPGGGPLLTVSSPRHRVGPRRTRTIRDLSLRSRRADAVDESRVPAYPARTFPRARSGTVCERRRPDGKQRTPNQISCRRALREAIHARADAR